MEQQSALDRFKDTPEFILLVASYLDQEDIISLQVTSRKMYSHTHPLYYRRVYLDGSSSLSNLRQAAIHARYISSLTVEEEIRGSYYSAIAEVFKIPRQGLLWSTRDTRPARPFPPYPHPACPTMLGSTPSCPKTLC
jgi:hypothetical protein